MEKYIDRQIDWKKNIYIDGYVHRLIERYTENYGKGYIIKNEIE